MTEVEQQFSNLCELADYSTSYKCDFELQMEKDAKSLKDDWFEKSEDLVKQYKLDSPQTNEEEEKNPKAFGRMRHRKLALLVKQRFPDAPTSDYVSPWILPRLVRSGDDSLRQTAEKCITELFPTFDQMPIGFQVLGNAPISHFVQRYSNAMRKRLGFDGSVMFFFPVLIHNKRPNPISMVDLSSDTRSLELATDQTLVEPNWEVILECVDMIRGGEIPVKEALKCIQKRYHNANPHISHHALLILEACVKNCGKKFIREVATKEFMDDLKSMVISNPPEKIRDKLLELIQCWTSAFKGIPEFKIVEDTHSLLKMNGFEFLPIDEAKAMFLADCAPDWAEGENCYRCRVEFGVFTRKHHCRACGQIFCDKCSNKQMLLPQFGIEKKVRVCEACFDKSSNQTSLIATQAKSRSDSDTKSKVDDETREKARKEAEEQEELQLALAISQSEAEAKERDKWSNLYSQYNGQAVESVPAENRTNVQQVESDPPKNSVRDELSLCMGDDVQEQPFDSMLAKYLDRDYWERKRRETEEAQARATAPPPSEVSISVSSSVSQSQQPQMNGVGKGGAATAIENNNKAHSSMYIASQNQLDSSLGTPSGNKLQHQQQFSGGDELSALYTKMDLSDIVTPQKALDANAEEEVAETSEFCRVLKERVDTLNTRMRSNQLRGRSIVNDSAIHSLFSQLSDAHGKVLERMNGLEGKREHYERLQDHLAHIGEARQAVDALREENERQRQEMQRAEQDKRQTQLKQKLELMRHKKHEMLLNERQVAIQRFQHNERQILHQRMMNLQSPQNLGALAVHNHQQQIAPTAIQPQHFPTQNAVDQPNQHCRKGNLSRIRLNLSIR
uniref:Hepatocyte growth factor-regulated tyrosine kinase substrate n=1 Tax=Globodera pallida TaxID=36090 RepID=A0A183BS91_GLOPA